MKERIEIDPRIDLRVQLKEAIDEAVSRLERGEEIPAYVERGLVSLLNYRKAFWKRVTRDVIAPTVVERLHQQGKSRIKSNKSTSSEPQAYELAAKALRLSETTVESADRAARNSIRDRQKKLEEQMRKEADDLRSLDLPDSSDIDPDTIESPVLTKQGLVVGKPLLRTPEEVAQLIETNKPPPKRPKKT